MIDTDIDLEHPIFKNRFTSRTGFAYRNLYRFCLKRPLHLEVFVQDHHAILGGSHSDMTVRHRS